MNSLQNVQERDYEQQIKYAAGVAATHHVSVTVPAGQSWRILHGLVSHDDPAAHTGYYSVTLEGDAEGEKVLAETASLAQNVRRQVYSELVVAEPLILNAGDIFTWHTNAMAAGQKAYLWLWISVSFGQEK